MSDEMIMAILGVIVALIAVLTPIFKLNNNIVRLTTVVERLENLVKEKTDKLDTRVTEHGKEIDALKVDVEKHDLRLKQLEK